MRRGFKAQAERLAEQIRAEMGIWGSSGLDAVALAAHAGAEVRRADELTGLSKLQELEALQPGAFSACTFHVKGRPVIVYSPLASHGRTKSDLAHEVSHILLGHRFQTIQQLDGVSFFTCDPDEEQEANWLAGCLLLPRILLLQAMRRGLSANNIAKEYGVSSSMAEFRIRATGVSRQLRAARRPSST